ncbi:drebrin isoform X5 [Nelusetta ayraudi]|uniref:drebrin isoform X5 n=1 Tax=Nelusetta ayraudi TaxID=303726 RepID=UPI003F6F0E3C
MAVNLAKNRLLLLTAYQDVIDETSDTDWALYSYDDESNDLTLASSGGGGLSEIMLTFDNSRVMYGFCSLKEPSAALPRYILINWVGEDVPDARKCSCASHVATIADFFQGVEVIINASSLDDIEPSAIGQRLTNGTVSVASPVLTRLKTREEEHVDVGTVYEKTDAEMEMKKINREEFWEQAKREEELRKEDEKKKVAEERQRYEEERMELERLEQENREKRYRERELEIEEHRKKLQEEDEAKERLQTQTTIAAELSVEELQLDKKETEVEEAKAIIAQRSWNPREFFKQKEKAMTVSVDSSPVALHRTASTERSVAAVSPIPKIVTTAIKEDEYRDEWGESEAAGLGSEPQQKPTKPVQSVAPQARDSSSSFSSTVGQPGTDSLVDLWDGGPAPRTNPTQTGAQSSNLVDLMDDVLHDDVAPSSATAAAGGGKPQPLLSFDEMMDGTFCGGEDEPSSLVDMTASDQMTLSYQHALQHASGEELEDGQLLMTNGETLLKEGTQQASEGYFSQSQEEEFGQSDVSSAKPAPVFYNKPPEIDITCWDTDPVGDEDDD